MNRRRKIKEEQAGRLEGQPNERSPSKHLACRNGGKLAPHVPGVRGIWGAESWRQKGEGGGKD
jgi:hypothetical protein